MFKLNFRFCHVLIMRSNKKNLQIQFFTLAYDYLNKKQLFCLKAN